MRKSCGLQKHPERTQRSAAEDGRHRVTALLADPWRSHRRPHRSAAWQSCSQITATAHRRSTGAAAQRPQRCGVISSLAPFRVPPNAALLPRRPCDAARRAARRAQVAEVDLFSRRVSRTCGITVHDNDANEAYWWVTAAINAAWARTHSYDHLLYCITSCAHPDSGEERWTAWCKIVAIADAFELGGYDTVLYLDSDAFWKDATLPLVAGVVTPFAHPPDWSHPPRAAAAQSKGRTVGRPTVYFGCNSPWEICRSAWNFSAPHAHAGSANTGVVLLRRARSTWDVLHAWWQYGGGRAGKLARNKCSDQDALWRDCELRTGERLWGSFAELG